jgi:sugar/nucleoside kinase (ribokinase family)
VDVVGVGANSVDLVYRLPTVPQRDGPDAKLRIRGRSVSCGGQVTTALSTCAAMGLSTSYVGATGDDDNGRRMREELSNRRVNLDHAVIRDVVNPFAVILIDERSGERIVLWDRDERLALRADELPAELIASARLVHVDDVDQDAAIRTATIARAAGVPVTSDIDRLNDRTDELVDAVSIPILAEPVPQALTGEGDFERALRKLRRRHAGLLCVTLGSQGAVLLAGDELFRSPAFPVQAVDTTGAGDVFRGAFVYALLRGDGPADMLRFANAAAAISCTRLGAMNGVPTVAETTALMEARR